MKPEIDSIWRDNYDAGTGRFRHVRILSIDGESAEIQACEPDGSPRKGRAPKTWTGLSRFNGGKSGFTFVFSPQRLVTCPTCQGAGCVPAQCTKENGNG